MLMSNSYISSRPHRVGKRKLTPLERLINELKSIGLARLNAIGNGQISTYVAEVELELKESRMKELGEAYNEGYTY